MTSPGRSRGRRRLTALVAVVLLAGVAIGACTFSAHPSRVGSGGQPPGTGGNGSTASTVAVHKNGPYDIGVRVYGWDDTSRDTDNPVTGVDDIPGRKLTTEIWYPALSGSTTRPTGDARPATGDGPFPVVFFAHGLDLTPQYYAALLDYWVRDGFVVVAPLFPDEQTDTVVASGGPVKSKAQYDVDNEPGDVAYVLDQFASLDQSGSGSVLSRIGNLAELALTGQSDGANVVGAVAYGSQYTAELAALPATPKAVVLLSGSQLDTSTGNTETATATSPPVLQIQSNTDVCNDPDTATSLFNSLDDAPVHLFMTLDDVTHLAPYSGGADSQLVETVTTDFLELQLDWHAAGLSEDAIVAAGTRPGTASVSATPAPLPPVAGYPTACAAELPKHDAPPIP